MFTLSIVLLLVKSGFLTAFMLENDAFVEVFNPELYDSESQLERITNIQSNANKSHGIVARFLGHYNSLKPVAVLLDDTEEAYNSAGNFFKEVFATAPNAKHINFTFFKFNLTGVSPIFNIDGKLEYTFDHETSYLGRSETNGTAAFFAILNAAAVIPRNGAILAFLNRKIADEDLAGHTGLLRKKSQRVYIVWGRPYSTQPSQERLLRELCEYTGGLFLTDTEKNLSEYNYGLFLENARNFNVSTILSRSGLVGSSKFTFPIDSKVTDIHIRISPSEDSGSLSSPKGYIIDISKTSEIVDYSTGSFDVKDPELHEVHLTVATPTAQTQGVGFWRIELNNAREPYNVTVFAFTKLTVNAYFAQKNSSTVFGVLGSMDMQFGSDN